MMAVVGSLLLAAGLTSCQDDPDNYYSKNKSEIGLTVSSDYLILNESAPNDTALTLDWTKAYNFGNDYITTYQYEMQLIGSSANEVKEYEDDAHFHRAYTNAELQDLLVNHFGQKTSTIGNLLLTVTASFEGPTLVVPDIATKTIRIKTYGPKQFMADRLFMAGTAVGNSDVELTRSEADSMIYTYSGKLSAGTINFPVLYADDENAIGPSDDNTAVTLGDMPAVITSRSEAKSWTIPAEDTYRITVNLTNHTVKIVAVGAVVEADQLFLDGSAVPGGEQIQLTQTLENSSLYAWRGQLNAGNLYIPLTFNGEQQMAIVPIAADSHDINDGQSQSFTQATVTAAAASRYWTIPSAGTYRIVVNTEEKTITIYSPTTDLKSKVVTWNNTTLKINPYTTVVDTLYMYGTFNGFAHDPGVFTGYQDKYILKQSVANPYVFVYSGEELPRGTANDERANSVTGSVKFTVDNTNNNVYAYGSTASAKRNDHNGYISPALGETSSLVAGQSDNRYAYFIIPEGCNYVVVDIDKLTVVFGKK
jgi:hypothetical protein